MGIEFIVLIVAMMLLFWWMSRSARKQQERILEQREAAIVVGAGVVTNSGFLGKVVDIDGDAVTLESPDGTETVWVRSAISAAMDIPVADLAEDEADIAEVNAEEADQAAGDELSDELVDSAPATAAEAIASETQATMPEADAERVNNNIEEK